MHAPLHWKVGGMHLVLDHRSDLENRVERVLKRDDAEGRGSPGGAVVPGVPHQVLHHAVQPPLRTYVRVAHEGHGSAGRGLRRGDITP